MSQPKLGNPAVVGLAGFSLTTLLFQFYNLGLCGMGPVFALAVVFGGLAQFIAGLLEHRTGNNFGFCSFTGFGAFWLCFAAIQLGNHYRLFESSARDMGCFMVVFTLYAFVLWVGSLKIDKAMFINFSLLLVGFVLVDLASFGFAFLAKAAAGALILCALCAMYMLAHILFLELFGRDVLPVGEPVL